jgi:DNA-binding transcriptional LysR family regulator
MEPTIYGETMIRHARMALTSLSLAHDDIVALKAGLSGQVEVGVIMTPAMALLPRRSRAPRSRRRSCASACRWSSPTSCWTAAARHAGLHDRPHPGAESAAGLIYEELTEEPACAVVRPGHPLLKSKTCSCATSQPAVDPAAARQHPAPRCDMMFRRAGLEVPVNVVDTTALLLITAAAADRLAARDADRSGAVLRVAECAEHPADRAAVPMDAFGIITVDGHILSPGAELLLKAVREVAKEMYWDIFHDGSFPVKGKGNHARPM